MRRTATTKPHSAAAAHAEIGPARLADTACSILGYPSMCPHAVHLTCPAARTSDYSSRIIEYVCYSSSSSSNSSSRSSSSSSSIVVVAITGSRTPTHQVLPYERLRGALGLGSVRELEDFLINHAFYDGVVTSGKLDQQSACLQVGRGGGRAARASGRERFAT
jgi:hypothetical protein